MTEAISSSSNDYYLPDQNETVQEQKGLADPDAFLKILVAQLKYQNPMEPQDSSEFVSQMSQMASMEQMYKVSTSMDKMAAQYEMDRYFQLIGRQVSLVDGDEVVTGQVGGVYVLDDGPYFYLGNDNDYAYTLDQVISITGSTNENMLLPYLSLVGRQVTVKDNDSEVTGVVEKVLLQNGSVSVMIEGTEYSAGQIIELHHTPEESTNPGEPETGGESTEPEDETGTTGESTTEV